MKKRLTITISLLCIFFVLNLSAQSANLSIQGVLRKSNGTAVENGAYSLTFNLYTTETGGTSIWTETINDVDVEGGIYSVVLGANGTALDVAFDEPYFLGVSVEGGTELIPRARLTSSPYALSLIGDDNIFPNSGNVGVGSATPNHKLTVQNGNGTIGIQPGETANFTAVLNTTGTSLNFETPTNKDFTFQGGNLGIGSLSPSNKLHVKSNGQMLFLEGTDHAYMAFGRNGTTRSGYFGYGGTNTTMTLMNETGETHIKGSRVRLIPQSGDTGVESDFFVNGIMRVNGTNTRCRLYGTASAYFGFYPHNNTRKGYFGFTSSSDNLSLVNESNGSIYMKSVGGDIYIDPVSSSKTIFLDGFVRARGSRNISINDYLYLYAHLTNSNARYYPGHYDPTNEAYSIEADQGIKAPRFHQKSDRRIKKDFRLSDAENDLAMLSTIEVTDYRHIDEIRDGDAYRKGLVAQQVESVFPQAIKKGKEYIPSVYAFPLSISIDENGAQFNLSKAHDFEAGDKIKIFTAKGEEFFTVASIINKKSFTIVDWKGGTEAKDFFVYGKEVADFRTVDYDRVFTLALSATQELARKVETLEVDLAAAQKENAKLRQQLMQNKTSALTLQAQTAQLEDRLKRLEAFFNTTGNRD